MTISMKKTIKYFMAALAFSAAALVSGPAASAQDGSVKFDKRVTGPNADGVYTINLEAYVTGSVTVTTETKPADIVLVLDYSQSMNSNKIDGVTRINLLRSSVQEFVDIVKASNETVTEDRLGGHRIAFVLYAGSVFDDYSGLNQFIKVDELTTASSAVRYNGTNLIGHSTQQGTQSGEAMEEARDVLAEEDYSGLDRSRIVVFFTDGVPGTGAGETWTSDRVTVANQCISAANEIKNHATNSATIYAVGMFTQQASATQTTTYLSYTSSDYTDKTSLPSSSSNWVNVSGDKSIIVSSSQQLRNIFSSIASQTGGDYNAASSSSVLVDIVTNSFTISEDTDLGTVQVYQVPCTQASKTAMISWASRSNWTEITDIVDLVSDPETGEVRLWCQLVRMERKHQFRPWKQARAGNPDYHQ